jgi:hypothetical protein
MKLSKFLSLASIMTCLSLLYVWQQTEVFRLAYLGQKRQAVFQDLLDKNSVLRYNIKRNISLTNIGNKVYESNDFQMPDTYRLVRLTQPKGSWNLKAFAAGRQTLFARLFGIRRQAEAGTIN